MAIPPVVVGVYHKKPKIRLLFIYLGYFILGPSRNKSLYHFLYYLFIFLVPCFHFKGAQTEGYHVVCGHARLQACSCIFSHEHAALLLLVKPSLEWVCSNKRTESFTMTLISSCPPSLFRVSSRSAGVWGQMDKAHGAHFIFK